MKDDWLDFIRSRVGDDKRIMFEVDKVISMYPESKRKHILHGLSTAVFENPLPNAKANVILACEAFETGAQTLSKMDYSTLDTAVELIGILANHHNKRTVGLAETYNYVFEDEIHPVAPTPETVSAVNLAFLYATRLVADEFKKGVEDTIAELANVGKDYLESTHCPWG